MIAIVSDRYGPPEVLRTEDLIDLRFDRNAVPDAIRYQVEGHTRGKVVINVRQPAPRTA